MLLAKDGDDLLRKLDEVTGGSPLNSSRLNLWSLVNRQTVVCQADALSRGTVLVDFPNSDLYHVSDTAHRTMESLRDKIHFTLASTDTDRWPRDAVLGRKC